MCSLSLMQYVFSINDLSGPLQHQEKHTRSHMSEKVLNLLSPTVLNRLRLNIVVQNTDSISGYMYECIIRGGTLKTTTT